MSDDEDQNEDEVPDDDDELVLPNYNTDRNVANEPKLNCSLCSYQAKKGLKQLIKHYVCDHPGKYMFVIEA